jgi:hypothetical protein
VSQQCFGPGNIWLVEQALHIADETAPTLRTRFFRGWVEPISDHPIPTASALTKSVASTAWSTMKARNMVLKSESTVSVAMLLLG